jgi:hypothetical protein
VSVRLSQSYGNKVQAPSPALGSIKPPLLTCPGTLPFDATAVPLNCTSLHSRAPQHQSPSVLLAQSLLLSTRPNTSSLARRTEYLHTLSSFSTKPRILCLLPHTRDREYRRRARPDEPSYNRSIPPPVRARRATRSAVVDNESAQRVR